MANLHYKIWRSSAGMVVMLVLCFLTTTECGSSKPNSPQTGLPVHRPDSSVLLSSPGLINPVRPRRNVQEGIGPANVSQFHIKSKVQARLAEVTIESEVLNTAQEESQEISFQVQIPEEAFMSSLICVVVDGKNVTPQVFEMEEAERNYEEAKAEGNKTAVQMKRNKKQPETGMELFDVHVILQPNTSCTVTIAYTELLERRNDIFTQRLAVQPGSVVANLSLRACFSERQGFEDFGYTLPGSDTYLTTGSDAHKTQLTAGDKSRELVYRPTMEMQRSFQETGIHGEVIITYSLNNDPDGGSIILKNHHFAHFSTPPIPTQLPKNILFVVDISYSMRGTKIKQAREAMLEILEDMKSYENDTFNILLFYGGVKEWRSSPSKALDSEIEKAKKFVRDKMRVKYNTNINLALTHGLDLLLKRHTGKACDPVEIIVFLTDGKPEGSGAITDGDIIRSNVKNKNRGRAFIFSLSFGLAPDFVFLNSLSYENGKQSARRIYANDDAKQQLMDFYAIISKPGLCDAAASYNKDVVAYDHLTPRDVPIFFKGKEVIVTGKTKMAATAVDRSTFNATLRGMGKTGQLDFAVAAEKIEVLDQPDVEKLWAYMQVKNLLKVMNAIESDAEKKRIETQALNMSLTYSFVTPLTSFSIRVEDAESVNARSAGHVSAFNWQWALVTIFFIFFLFL